MTKTKSADAPNRDKGSYRHMLDLVSASTFRDVVNSLLDGTDSHLAEADCRHPIGRLKKTEWTETILEDYMKRHPLPESEGLHRKWWIPFKGNRPTWDLICHLEVEGKPGLLLVEAKAHLDEMSEKNCKSPVDKKNERSIANDLSIRLRLAETSLALSSLGAGFFHLSADHDYQLSNRLAYLHKLACDGVPVVLMYLGWEGSSDWTIDPFPDGAAWREAVKGHFERIGPWQFVETQHRLESGVPYQMIVRSLSPRILPLPPCS
ncbi:hypothetical protein [Planctomicrobium sp. SH527]|uniref:hypothetical protein n=1 Tax=Planctomicrobium sp. SH527 TaxID=3448123 RepID=UPI003F5B25DF